MKQSIKECGEHMLSAIRRPEVRHSLHYQCGLYKSPAERSPVASMNIHNDCAIPLVRLLAIVGALALIAMAARSVVCCVKKHCRCARGEQN